MTAIKAPPTNATQLYQTTPPAFGPDVRILFGFDPNYLNLNNGSFGALPHPVRAYCETLTSEIESNPDNFARLTYIPRLDSTRERIAKFIGARTNECVIVGNTTSGIAVVLHNLIFHEGDIIVGTSTTYLSVATVLNYISDTPPKPKLSIFNLEFPTTHTKIIQDFRDHIHQLTKIPDPTGKRKIVAVIDSIVSTPGALLPWKEMVVICREAGVLSVIDAAHSMGQELDINLSQAQPDFWVANCYKWLFAKRPCAVLYVPERNQHYIKFPFPSSPLYQSPQDPGYIGPQKFATLFSFTSTVDYVANLSIGAAMDFREWLGGECKINEYTHALALEGGKRLAAHLGTSLMDRDGEFTLSMVNVELPIPGKIEESGAITFMIFRLLLNEWNAFVSIFRHNEKWWVRCSAQIWNEISDFDKIVRPLLDVCEKVKAAGASGADRPAHHTSRWEE